MVRKGINRAHTGCLTCKVRRIKCDEGHPHCTKCVSTGRKCEGYQVWVPRAQRLRLGPSTLPGVQSPDLRSLDFFRQIVAPRLAMPVSRCFWTHVLPQVTQQEPAIRHAIVALSSLYENLLDSIIVPVSQRKFPATHYNAAIKQITTPQLVPINMDVVVMTCLLFMSIDLFSGNIKGAIDHFRHGQKLVSTYKTTPHMAGIFRQLNICSLFLSELSHLQATFIPQKSELNMEPFESITEAGNALDSFMHRSLHVLSAMDYASSSIPKSRAKNQIRSMQRALNEDMDIWTLRLQQLTKYEPVHKPKEIGYLFKLEVRWHVCKIWINFGPSGEEHTIQYTSARRIFGILSMLHGTDGTTDLPFEVDTGLPPILYLIFMNSPNLDFRLAALDLFRDKYWWEKNIPDCRDIYAAGKQFIHKDFGVILGPEWLDIETSPRMQHLRVPIFSRFQSLCSWTVVLADVSEQIQKLELKPTDQSNLVIRPTGSDMFSLLT